MYKYFTALFFISSPAIAQEPLIKFFATEQTCGTPEVMFQESWMYEEEPLFVGETLVYGIDRQPYWGQTFFTANQANGYWTLYTFYAGNVVCMTASGIKFAPYVE